ncbi:MAG: aminotransferase class I/II-fold pyridoxal phosphate-dependent enzyme, partial [Clostridia bacterium]|nr:aminotransferase class I/II-fold pyridoxal phosphate-dependent enzyme [Clostridia bacterium]
MPAPECVKETMAKLITEKDPVMLHGYTSAQGDLNVRKAMADYITNNFNITADADLIYMTCGAAASLTVTLNAICNNGDEVIVLAPF